jgi:hypothetical protein
MGGPSSLLRRRPRFRLAACEISPLRRVLLLARSGNARESRLLVYPTRILETIRLIRIVWSGTCERDGSGPTNVHVSAPSNPGP